MDNFDRIVKEKVEGAESAISDRVWKNIQASLPPEKKKTPRRLIFMLAAFGFLAAGTLVAYLLTEQSGDLTPSVITDNGKISSNDTQGSEPESNLILSSETSYYSNESEKTKEQLNSVKEKDNLMLEKATIVVNGRNRSNITNTSIRNNQVSYLKKHKSSHKESDRTRSNINGSVNTRTEAKFSKQSKEKDQKASSGSFITNEFASRDNGRLDKTSLETNLSFNTNAVKESGRHNYSNAADRIKEGKSALEISSKSASANTTESSSDYSLEKKGLTKDSNDYYEVHKNSKDNRDIEHRSSNVSQESVSQINNNANAVNDLDNPKNDNTGVVNGHEASSIVVKDSKEKEKDSLEKVNAITKAQLKEANKNKKNSKELSFPPLSADVFLTPTYSHSNVSGGVSTLQEIRDNEKSKLSMGAGVRFGVHLNEKWRAGLGFNYSSYGDRSVIKSGAEKELLYVSYNIYQDSSGAWIYQPIDTAKFMKSFSKKQVAVNSYKYIGIPVFAAYQLLDGKIGLTITGGVTANILAHAQTNTLIYRSDTTVIVNTESSNGNNSPFRPIVFSAFISPGLSYKINDKLKVILDPGFTWFMTSIYKPEYAIKRRIIAAELRAGVQFTIGN